jgi:DNA-binding transcriptional MerR regulator
MNEKQEFLEEFFGDFPSLDKDEREKMRQAWLWYGEAVIPNILERLLSEGLVDPDKAHDRHYVDSLVRENMGEIVPHIPTYIAVENSFLEVASYSLEIGKPEVAVVLVATAIEHAINIYYIDLLSNKGLAPKEIKQALRTNNFESKLGWLMQLTSSRKLPEELGKRIKELVEIRNAIAHYKPLPVTIGDEDSGIRHTWEKISERIQGLNPEDMMALPGDLQEVLDSMLDEIYPIRQKVEELLSTLRGRG